MMTVLRVRLIGPLNFLSGGLGFMLITGSLKLPFITVARILWWRQGSHGSFTAVLPFLTPTFLLPTTCRTGKRYTEKKVFLGRGFLPMSITPRIVEALQSSLCPFTQPWEVCVEPFTVRWFSRPSVAWQSWPPLCRPPSRSFTGKLKGNEFQGPIFCSLSFPLE